MIYKILPPITFTSDEEMLLAIEQLPESEQHYLSKVKHRQGIREKLTAYRLLQECLTETGITTPFPQIIRPEKGKPYLQDHPTIGFNISHSKNCVAVAVNEEGEVGIDVECRRRCPQELIAKVCNKVELAAIAQSQDPEMCFLKFWTQKEAYLKMTGKGINGFEQLQTVPPPPSALIKTTSVPLSHCDGIVSIYWEVRQIDL